MEMAQRATSSVPPKIIYTSQSDQKTRCIFLGSILLFLAVWYERKREKERERKGKEKEETAFMLLFKTLWETFNYREENFHFI